ncbi:helix-turn-helix transcriptional regulator [Saccharopolyspora erythraea]|uniref:helix-turn-helix domain-containing protein n=1 Tax=Saccharopolyspora erythraea TaxID=1836 RepID=UPI001BA6CD6B|nr:helix-turn-helix transcriptional regulator [Saccharopolyspora erythraea]QUH01467.1 helix-turn-helix transcriptional regulator [Saccharopolyspora erythraea]
MQRTTGHGDQLGSAADAGGSGEHPHDTEDLVRLVSLARREQGWMQADLAAAAGVPESDVASFEAGEVVPAKRVAFRYLEAMGRVEPGVF